MINKVLNIDHINTKGNEGLYREEITAVIKSVSKNNFTTFDVEYKRMESNIAFWQNVYHSIESRFPVILLLKTLKNNANAHAVALLGHSLNEHNWWSYGTTGKYGMNVDEHSYLSSSLWCDSFIVNDDLVGPHYILPMAFQKNCGTNPFMSSFNKVRRWIAPLKEVLYEPMLFLSILPNEIAPYWSSIISAEYEAIEWLYKFINANKSDTQISKLIKFEDFFFNTYFYEYYLDKSLITRVIAVKKDEYIESIKDQEFLKKHIEDIKDILPSFMWIVEISIPELFWINKRKIGEIILNPKQNNAVILCRLPNWIYFKKSNETVEFLGHQYRRHYEMIKPSGIYDRIIGEDND